MYVSLPLFHQLAPFTRGRHSGVIHTTDLAHVLRQMPFLPQPSPESALTCATPVLGHTHSLIHTHSLCQFTLSNSLILHVFGLWGKPEHPEETHAPGGNPRRDGENLQTPHRKPSWLSRDSNQGPSCCEAPCHVSTKAFFLPAENTRRSAENTQL